jgi:Zn-dependent protease with chaperone function
LGQAGSLFDGSSARAHAVEVDALGESLRIKPEVGVADVVPSKALRLLSEDDRQVRLIRTDAEGWSLRLDKPIANEVASILPKTDRYGRLIDRVGLVPALSVLATLTAAVIVIGYVAPHWIAPHVPMSWERRFGGAMFGDFGKMRCRDPKGQKALEDLVERVAPGATKGPDGVKVAALDVPVFNAAALPGGYIVVFEPAIRESSPEALAGIMAHEMAHVRRRHVTEALIREMGIGALIRMFAGNVGGNAEQILALSYTRDNEAQADSDAIVMLRKADISPKPIADLFTKLSKTEGVGPGAEFLQSHPLTGKRAQKFSTSFDPKVQYAPALSPDEAHNLLNICKSGSG